MENEHISPDESKEFNQLEVEIKQALAECDDHLLESASELEKVERYLIELQKDNKEFRDAGLEPFESEERTHEDIEKTKEMIRQLKEVKARLRKQLQRYYEVDEKRYQSGL